MSTSASSSSSVASFYHQQIRRLMVAPELKSFPIPEPCSVSGSWYATESYSTKIGSFVVLSHASSLTSSKDVKLVASTTPNKTAYFLGDVSSSMPHGNLEEPLPFRGKGEIYDNNSLKSKFHLAYFPSMGTPTVFGVVAHDGEVTIMGGLSHWTRNVSKNADDPFVRIALSKRSIVLLSRDGVLKSVGYSFDGIRGFKHWPEHSPDFVLSKVEIDDVKFVQVSGGILHFSALSDTGDVYAWGRNNRQQCAMCPTRFPHFSKPNKVKGLPQIIAVESGKYFTLALSTTLKLYGWGGRSIEFRTPRIVDIPNNETPLKISANGGTFFAVLTDRGNVYVFSENFTLVRHLNNETGVPRTDALIVNITAGHGRLSLVEFHDRHNPNLILFQENLAHDLMSLLQAKSQSAVKVKFQDRVFKLHRGILAARSLLFEKLFSEEKEEYDVTSYVPSTTTPGLFASAIDFIYSATVPRGDKNAIDMISPIIKGLKVRTELGEDVVYNLKQELNRDIGSMITKDEQRAKIFGSDVTFTFKDSDTKLFAHKFILTKRSSYFSAMFNSGLSESHGSIVEMVDVSEQVLQLILNYIYTGKVDSSSITIDNCIEAMITANEYDEQGLCMFIEDQVVRLIDLETVHVLSDLAKRFKFSYLDERCEFFMHCHADVLKHFGNNIN